MPVIKPAPLRKGDVIGIVAPASPPSTLEKITKGAEYLERLGYRVTLGRNVHKVYGYLAGTDEERAADINSMFADRTVKAGVAAPTTAARRVRLDMFQLLCALCDGHRVCRPVLAETKRTACQSRGAR